jgi:hypothetical protein
LVPFTREPGILGRGLCVGEEMMDLLSRMERNRKEAAKFSDLAKSAPSAFLRDYYRRIAERYLMLEGEWRPPGGQGSASQSRAAYPSATGYAPGQ